MIYFGCSQWGYDNWLGHLYPPHGTKNKYLGYYGKIFNTVEVNSTYHDYVEPKRIIRWRELVGNNFKFCPKFPKTISHDKLLIDAQRLTEDFIDRVKLFKDSLGISFLQLHPDFAPRNFDILHEYLQSLPKDFKVSVELRPFWLEHDEILNEALAILKCNKAGLVIVDRYETMKYLNKMKLTNHSAFIRFDTYTSDVDKKRIDAWVNMIKRWNEKGLPEIYFFLHFPENTTDFKILDYAMEQFDKHFLNKKIVEKDETLDLF